MSQRTDHIPSLLSGHGTDTKNPPVVGMPETVCMMLVLLGNSVAEMGF